MVIAVPPCPLRGGGAVEHINQALLVLAGSRGGDGILNIRQYLVMYDQNISYIWYRAAQSCW